MFAGDADKAAKAQKVIDELGKPKTTKGHDRHISFDRAKEIGLKVEALEDDPDLQDAVLSLHHAVILTLSSTSAVKIIENHLGTAMVQQVRVGTVQTS